MGNSVENDPFVAVIDLPKADADLIDAYRSVGRTVDDLAYTEEFDRLFEQYQRAGHQATRSDVFRRLLVLRKSGLLPRMFR
ncbi:MAG: hypothetical protein JWO31_3967 [Phycisphaerales bacterium]|nr:hypothetical protein [Phycisphaerales bacterium]